MSKAENVSNLFETVLPKRTKDINLIGYRYISSYKGWVSILKDNISGTGGLYEFVGGIVRVLKAADNDALERFIGHLDGIIDKLIKDLQDLKKLNKQLLDDIRKG